MRSAPHILLCCLVVLCSAIGHGETAKNSSNTEQLTAFAQTVASVLSPTLLSELQGNRANRSAVNLGRTSSRKRDDQPEGSSATDKSPPDGNKPEVQYFNHVYPYHYERRYQYSYPPYTEHHGGFYGPYVPPLSAPSPHFYHSGFYSPHGFPSTHYGAGNTNGQSNGNAGENSVGAESSTPNTPEANGPVNRNYDGSHLYSPFSKFHDFHKIRHGPIPNSFLPGGYGYFGPAGFGPHVPYHSPFFHPQQNPTTTPEQTEPKEGEAENNSASPNQKVQYAQPAYGSPLIGSFHLQGYPSTAFNLLPSERFNNVYNGNFTQQPYGGLPFVGFHGGPRNPYLPPSTTPAPDDENDNREKLSELAEKNNPAETISTSGSARRDAKILFPATVYDGPNVRRSFPPFR